LSIPVAASDLQCVVECGAALPLSAIAFSPDGQMLAVGGYREVLIWDLAAGKLDRRIGMDQIQTLVQAVEFDSAGKQIAAAEGAPYDAGAVRVFDVESGQQVAAFDDPQDVVYCLAFSPDGKLLAAGCGDTAAYVYDTEQKQLAAKLEDHSLPVLCVAFNNEGEFLATGSADKTIQVWEVDGWKPDSKKTFLEDPVHACEIRSSREQKDGGVMHTFAVLVGGSEAREVQIRLDAKAPSWARKDFRGKITAGSPLACAWLTRGEKKAYVGSSDGTVKVFAEASEGFEPVGTLTGHSDWVYGIALSRDGSKLASASGDGTVRLWNTADDRPVATLVQVSPGTEQWLVVTTQGYFATNAPETVKWQTPGGEQVNFDALDDTEKVQKILAGEEVPAPSPS
jgi:WD40 repeat protein